LARSFDGDDDDDDVAGVLVLVDVDVDEGVGIDGDVGDAVVVEVVLVALLPLALTLLSKPRISSAESDCVDSRYRRGAADLDAAVTERFSLLRTSRV
jgi:hypothetical protein